MILALAIDQVRRMNEETIAPLSMKELLRLRRGERGSPFWMTLALAIGRIRRMNQENIALSVLKELLRLRRGER